MASEELFLRIDTYNQLNLAKSKVKEHNIEDVLSLYRVLCSFNEVPCEEYYIMTDKNQFRYIEKGGTIKVSPVVKEEEKLGFTASVVEFIREEVRELWSLVR